MVLVVARRRGGAGAEAMCVRVYACVCLRECACLYVCESVFVCVYLSMLMYVCTSQDYVCVVCVCVYMGVEGVRRGYAGSPWRRSEAAGRQAGSVWC